MTKYFCNPLNVDYRYQFNQQVMPGMGEGAIEVSREAADPSMICFKGKYYIFASMSELSGIMYIFQHPKEENLAIFIVQRILRKDLMRKSKERLISGIQTFLLMMMEKYIFIGDAPI